MVDHSIFSITRWVQILRSDQILAIACNSNPGGRPRHRHLLRPPQPLLPTTHLPADQKQSPEHGGVIRKISNHLLQGPRFGDSTEMVLNRILSSHAAVIALRPKHSPGRPHPPGSP